MTNRWTFRWNRRTALLNGLLATTALAGGAAYYAGDHSNEGSASAAVVDFANTLPTAPDSAAANLARRVTGAPAATGLAGNVESAMKALAAEVGTLSDDRALTSAFQSYFAYKAANPEQVRKPYLYFVDYGQPNTAKRGWVFDMEKLTVVDGPFTVAHGRGSGGGGVPTRFSNKHGSAATSLGLYLAQETYGFSGKAMGRYYTSIGLRMKGLSTRWNDNARARGVVAHGAPYVSASRAGRSEGCPAMEEARARRLLPKLANGGMVFLFAPHDGWLAQDGWVTADAG